MTDATTLTTVIYNALTNTPRRRPDGKRFGTIEADQVRTEAVLRALADAGLLPAPTTPPDRQALTRIVKAAHDFMFPGFDHTSMTRVVVDRLVWSGLGRPTSGWTPAHTRLATLVDAAQDTDVVTVAVADARTILGDTLAGDQDESGQEV